MERLPVSSVADQLTAASYLVGYHWEIGPSSQDSDKFDGARMYVQSVPKVKITKCYASQIRIARIAVFNDSRRTKTSRC